MDGTDTSPGERGNVIPGRGYGVVTIAFHWLTVALVLVAFTMGPGGSEQRIYSAASDFQREAHEVLGLSVFALTGLRLVWRALVTAPELPPLTGWMESFSRIVQGLLYVLLFAIPTTAVAGAWLEGHPLTLGFLGHVPPMIPEAHAAGHVVAEIHTVLGDTIVWLAGFHAAAALFHHFVLRDAVLLSMVPPRWRRVSQARSSCS